MFLKMSPQMFPDCNPQKPSPLAVLTRISGSCNPRTSGDPSQRTTVLNHTIKCYQNTVSFKLERNQKSVF